MGAVSEAANPEIIPVRRRGAGRPWKPGESGNPSGMPKEIAPAVLEARKLALSWAPKAIGRLAELLDDEDARVVAVAATALLDRAGVKPHAADGPGDTLPPPVDVDALRASLAQRLAALAGAGEATAALPPSGGPQGQEGPKEGSGRAQ